ncbi:MAG: hypothetical protein NTV34_20360, partial [Proteobacteria bacterium]|nr:hypothetical protein [Pseudomonadota bacterium]
VSRRMSLNSFGLKVVIAVLVLFQTRIALSVGRSTIIISYLLKMAKVESLALWRQREGCPERSENT